MDLAFADGNIPVVMNSDEGYLPYVMVTLDSMMANSKRGHLDVYILHDGMPQDVQDAFVSLSRGYEGRHSVRFVSVSGVCARMEVGSVSIRGACSKTASFRIIAPLVIPQVKRAIYLDGDVVVRADVADLFDTDLGDGAWLAAAVDSGACLNRDVIEGYAAWGTEHGFSDWTRYVNSGVMLMDYERLRASGALDRIAKLSASNKLYFADQDAINFTCNGHIRLLDPRWNVQLGGAHLEVGAAPEDGFIVHYTVGKPWKVVDAPFADEWWGWFLKRLSPLTAPVVSAALALTLKSKDELVRKDRELRHSLAYRLGHALTKPFVPKGSRT